MEHYENQPNSDLDLAPAAEYDTFDACFNAIIIIACLLLAVFAGCCAGYAYAQRQRPAPTPSQEQEQLLRKNYTHGIYADELADWHDYHYHLGTEKTTNLGKEKK